MTGLVREFLEFFGLEYSLAVFDPESSFVSIYAVSWPDFVGRCASPLRLFNCFAPSLKSHAPPLGKVSMIDRSENLTFFGCLGSTLRKKVFL